MTTPSPSRLLVLPLIVAAVLGFAFQGSRPLYETTEGRYAECAREIIETGNWLVPQLEYEPHWAKPPLTYWAIAGGMKLLGRNEWGVRLYEAIAFLLTTWLVLELALSMWEARTALVAGLVYATSPLVVIGNNTVSTDALLTLWATLMMLAFWRARPLEDGLARRGWIVAMWAACGFGFLTKGPVILIFLVPLLVHNLWMRRRGKPVPQLLSPAGLIAFAVIGLGWFLYVVLAHEGLLGYFLGAEVADRVFGNDFHRNPEWYKPFVMYLPLIAFGAAPWTLFWPWVIARQRRDSRPEGLLRSVLNSERALLLALLILVPLAVFFIAKSRLMLYVLPLMAPVALATSRGLTRLCEGRRLLVISGAIAAVLVAAGIPIKAFTAWQHSDKDVRPLYLECRKALLPGMAVLLCNEREFYSLQFYLDGRMRHVTTWTKDKATGTPLIPFLEELRDRDESTHCLLLIRKDIDDVRNALREAGYAWRDVKVALEFAFIVARPRKLSSGYARNH